MKGICHGAGGREKSGILVPDRSLEAAVDRLRAAAEAFEAQPCRGTADVLAERYAVFWRRRNGGSVGFDVALERLEAGTARIIAERGEQL